VQEPDEGDDEGGFKRDTEESVRPAAMVLQAGDRTGEGPEDVRVGGLGGEGHGEGGVAALRLKPARARHAPVRKWVTGSIAIG